MKRLTGFCSALVFMLLMSSPAFAKMTSGVSISFVYEALGILLLGIFFPVGACLIEAWLLHWDASERMGCHEKKS